MLDRSRLLAALESRAADFNRFERDRHHLQERLREALALIEAQSQALTGDRLTDFDSPGALPTLEWDHGLIRPFNWRFQHHPDAQHWAQGQLEGLTSFAADGSQIESDSRYSVPVALVQVGTFENRHLPEGAYRKETELRVLTPDDLKGEGPPKRAVDLARFELEVSALIRYMQTRPPGRTLVYMDGSLVASFAEKQGADPHARRYAQRLVDVIEASEATRTPLIAYVDGSRAKDLVRMVAVLSGEESGSVTDAMLLDGRLQWGDRTAAFHCAREGILETYGTHRRRIGFCYLQTREGHPPARLEFPSWLLDQLDPLVDAVRADVIAGGGYPYTLAAADATAVLTTSDRDRFQRTLEDFLAQKKIPMTFSTKALSKQRRR